MNKFGFALIAALLGSALAFRIRDSSADASTDLGLSTNTGAPGSADVDLAATGTSSIEDTANQAVINGEDFIDDTEEEIASSGDEVIDEGQEAAQTGHEMTMEEIEKIVSDLDAEMDKANQGVSEQNVGASTNTEVTTSA